MSTKYSILVIVNDAYMDLFKLYLQTLFANIDQSKLKNLIVADTGLSEKNRNWILNFNNKISIFFTGQSLTTTHIHSKEWIDTVSLKTKILLELIQNNTTPLILMDIDMIILQDFFDVIDSQYDIQFCKRAKQSVRADMTMDYIASFLVVNSEKAIPFIEDWIIRIKERIEEKTEAPYETPAMNELIYLNRHHLKIGFLDENIVSCDNNYIEGITKIIHIKSLSREDGYSLMRLSNIKNYNVCQLKQYLKLFTLCRIFIKKIISMTKDPLTGRVRIYFCNKKIFSYSKKTPFDKLYATRFDPNLTIEDKKKILSALFKKRVGYDIDWENPSTFNEKLQWLKLYNEDPLITKCAAKDTVKDFVKQTIGDEYLVPTIAIYDNVDEIDFDILPKSFVLKANWGSGLQMIVQDKSKLNINEIKKSVEKWLDPKSNHYFSGFESGYKDIIPKIICEEFLDFEYKLEFFCFNGDPKFFWVILNDKTNNKQANFYDLNWCKIPVKQKPSNFKEDIYKPVFFVNMLQITKDLCKDFSFVRTDFYVQHSSFKFSEMTFFHANGLEAMTPTSYDIEFGKMLKLPKRSI